MTDIQRWDIDYDPQDGVDFAAKYDGTGRFVTYADHVEALRQAEQRAANAGVSLGYERVYEQGQRDMLARCVAAVDGLGTYGIDSSPNLGDALAALRALGGSDG